MWGLDGGPAKDAVPKTLRDGIDIYRVITKWMFIVYIAAFVATVLELLVGFFAIFSRWGSFVTAIISGVSSTRSWNHCLPLGPALTWPAL